MTDLKFANADEPDGPLCSSHAAYKAPDVHIGEPAAPCRLQSGPNTKTPAVMRRLAGPFF